VTPHAIVRCVLVGLLALAAGCRGGAGEELPADHSAISSADRFFDVVALDAQTIVVVGYAGTILLSRNGGTRWETVPSGTDRALYAIDFGDAGHGWIVGQDGVLLHSVDRGSTWTRRPSGVDVHLFAVDVVDRLEGWAVGDRATYVHTSDGGERWSAGRIGGAVGVSALETLVEQEPVLYDVQFADPRSGWIVGEFGGIYHTADGGQTWTAQQRTLIGGEGIFATLDLPTFFGLSFTGGMHGIVAGLQSKVARTRDGGTSWRFEPFEPTAAAADPLYQPFQFADTTAWVVGAGGALYHQPSVGEPWQRVGLGRDVTTWLRGVHFLDKNDGWVVGGSGVILHTTDGGRSWLPVRG
jgi:photosystem II stability/assembly factor-like uncharacterized protein